MRIRRPCRVMSWPKIVTRPSRGGVRPTRLRSVVVLPAPLRPSNVDDLALVHRQPDVVQDVALAVEG